VYIPTAETIADVRSVLEHIHVRRNLMAVERMAFAGWGFKVVPPEDSNLSEKKLSDMSRELTKQLWEFNKLWVIQKKIPTTWENIMAFRWDVHEIAFGTAGKWTVPVYWEQLPAYSFSRTPAGYLGDQNCIADRLLKGILFHKNEKRYLFFQSQDAYSDPVQIPSENVFYITDPRVSDPDGRSYLSALVPTIKSHNLGRMSLNQTIARGGSPNMVVRVKKSDSDIPIPGGDAGTQYSPWWKYGEELARRQGKDTRIVIPEEIDLEWPDLKVALNPTEADHYFIQEIVDALVPVDPMKQLGTSLAKSSKELLEYLEKIFAGYREMCGDPYADLLTYIINLNGYEGWAIETTWRPVAPVDTRTDREHSLKSYQAGAITVSRFYEETGRLPPAEDELVQLYREMLIRAGRVDQLPALDEYLQSGNKSPTAVTALAAVPDFVIPETTVQPHGGQDNPVEESSIETVLQTKLDRVMKVLREFGYF